MKILEQVIARGSKCEDHRDFLRLGQFMTVEQLEANGFEFDEPEHKAAHVPVEWTEENVLKQLKEDVELGFKKALTKRNTSSIFMCECVRMWLFALDVETTVVAFDLEQHYDMYGLPLFKEVALKYGFDNPIGDDTGFEDKYNAQPGDRSEGMDNLFGAMPPELQQMIREAMAGAQQEQQQQTLQ